MTTEIDLQKCNGCKICYQLCPIDIIAWNEETNKPHVKYPDECQLCFICQVECPVEAVKVKVPLAFW